MDLEKLLIKSTSEHAISSEEAQGLIQYGQGIIKKIVKGQTNLIDELFDVITIVRKANLREQMGMLEAVLDIQEPMTSALVIEIIASDWDQLSAIMERVISYALGVNWDVEGDLQEVAVNVLVNYLARHVQERSQLVLQIVKLLSSLIDGPVNHAWVSSVAKSGLAQVFPGPGALNKRIESYLSLSSSN